MEQEIHTLTQNQLFMEQANSQLVHTINSHHSMIQQLNTTILEFQSAEVRENRSATDAANQLEIDYSLIEKEYNMLQEVLRLEADSWFERSELLEAQRDEFKRIADARELEIAQQAKQLAVDIEAFKLNAGSHIDMDAHIKERMEELDKREAELLLSRKNLTVELEVIKRREEKLEYEAELSIKKMAEQDRREKEFNMCFSQFEQYKDALKKQKTELEQQSETISDIVGASKDVLRRQKEIDQNVKEIADAKRLLHEFEKRNKDHEERNSKMAKDLTKRKDKFEASIASRETELSTRKQALETMDFNMTKRQERLTMREKELAKQKTELDELSQRLTNQHKELSNMQIMSGVEIVDVRFGPTQDTSMQTEEDTNIASQITVMELYLCDFVQTINRLMAAVSSNNKKPRHSKYIELLRQKEETITGLQVKLSKFEKKLDECRLRVCQTEQAMAVMQSTWTANEETIVELQADVAERDENIKELNGKLATLRHTEHMLREKTSEIISIQKCFNEAMVQASLLQEKNMEYKESVRQCEQVMEVVKARIVRDDQHMKEVQIEAAMRIQENERVHAENERLKGKNSKLKNKLAVQEELLQRLINTQETPIASVVYSPDSPMSPISVAEAIEDSQFNMVEMQQKMDGLEFELSHTISHSQIMEINMQSKLIKLEEAFEHMVNANTKTVRELTEQLMDKQNKEMDTFMKQHNEKLANLTNRLGDSEANNMQLLREKLDLDMDRSDAINKAARMGYELNKVSKELSELQIIRDIQSTPVPQGGKKKTLRDPAHALELAEKEIQIKNLTEELNKSRKQAAALNQHWTVLSTENASFRVEIKSLEERIKKYTAFEQQARQRLESGVKVQVIQLEGLDRMGAKVPIESDQVDKERTIQGAVNSINLTLGKPTEAERDLKSLLDVSVCKHGSNKKKRAAEKQAKGLVNALTVLQNVHNNFSAHEAIYGELLDSKTNIKLCVEEKSDDDEFILKPDLQDEPILKLNEQDEPILKPDLQDEPILKQDWQDEQDSDDDFNPFTMGENGIMAAPP